MKSEAKMAAYGGQFWTSVLIPYASLYVIFSLPRDSLHFLKIFLIENTRKTCLQKVEKESNCVLSALRGDFVGEIWNRLRKSEWLRSLVRFYNWPLFVSINQRSSQLTRMNKIG